MQTLNKVQKVLLRHVNETLKNDDDEQQRIQVRF